MYDESTEYVCTFLILLVFKKKCTEFYEIQFICNACVIHDIICNSKFNLQSIRENKLHVWWIYKILLNVFLVFFSKCWILQATIHMQYMCIWKYHMQLIIRFAIIWENRLHVWQTYKILMYVSFIFYKRYWILQNIVHMHRICST